MNNLYFILAIAFLFTIPVSIEIFAQTEYEIKIPSGASDPGAPFFWSEKNTGVTTGEITVYPGDSVTWHNADTAFHTITSVSASSIETGDFEVSLLQENHILDNLMIREIFTIFVAFILT